MTAVQAIARIPTASLGKLVCHPKLPLVAGIDQDRPAVHLYYAERVLREFGAVGADSPEYGKFDRWPVAVSDHVAFSPDGQSLWTSPTPPDLYDRSDAIDLDTGAVTPAPMRDGGIVAHPAGGLVATRQSDQARALCSSPVQVTGCGSSTEP